KDRYPAWKIENWHVYPDPRARFADPSNPDRPPRPPDDPAAYDLSPDPQKPGKAGIARIEGAGYLELIANWDRENRERATREEAEEKPTERSPPPHPRPGEGVRQPPMVEPPSPAARLVPFWKESARGPFGTEPSLIRLKPQVHSLLAAVSIGPPEGMT